MTPPATLAPAVSPMTAERDELARVIETDRAYFEMGARIIPLPGAELAWMSGLAGMASSAVVQRVTPEVPAAKGLRWIEEIEAALTSIGARQARIYLDSSPSAADPVLRRAGYRSREELAMAGSLLEPVLPMRLRPLTGDSDWRAKLGFHEAVPDRPDGHRSTAAQWVALERRKCAQGMEAFLAEVGGETVGAVGFVRGEGVLRIKNVVIHSAFRRHGYGRAMLSHLAGHGRRVGFMRQCLFAVACTPGEMLYRAVGFKAVGSQFEWIRDLGAERPV